MGAVGPLLGDPMAGRPITDDPSYQFRLDEGLKALERSAAARGTLLTGGAAKAMQRYAQDVASTEYQNSYARRAAEQSNDFNRLHDVGQLHVGRAGEPVQPLLQHRQSGAERDHRRRSSSASGYATNIGNTQLGQGNVLAGSTAAQGTANANLYTSLADAAGQGMTDYYRSRRPIVGQPPVYGTPPIVAPR